MKNKDQMSPKDEAATKTAQAGAKAFVSGNVKSAVKAIV
jgi:hypothetical protein